MFDRVEIKRRGKEAIKSNFGLCLLVTLIYGVLSTMASNSTDEKSLFQLSLAGYFAVKILIINPLEVGVAKFFLNNRTGEGSFADLFYGLSCGSYLNIVLVMFVRDLKIALWTLCFIIPGLIKGYEYYMLPFILADDCTLTCDAAFEKTKTMTDCRKFDIFVFDLSFIGWLVLIIFTLGIASLYFMPYVSAAKAELYTELA